MTKLPHRTVRLLEVIALLVISLSLLGGLSSFLINRFALRAYLGAVKDGELLTALSTNNEAVLATYHQKDGLEYQKIDQGKVVSASNDQLPNHRFFLIKHNFSPNVLLQPTR